MGGGKAGEREKLIKLALMAAIAIVIASATKRGRTVLANGTNNWQNSKHNKAASLSLALALSFSPPLSPHSFDFSLAVCITFVAFYFTALEPGNQLAHRQSTPSPSLSVSLPH